MTFKEYVKDDLGMPKPGALSRFAEALGTRYNTVRSWFRGDSTPDEYWQRRLQILVNAKLNISRKPRCDIGKKRAKKNNSRSRKRETGNHWHASRLRAEKNN